MNPDDPLVWILGLVAGLVLAWICYRAAKALAEFFP